MPFVGIFAADAGRDPGPCACCPTETDGHTCFRPRANNDRSVRLHRATDGSSASGSCSNPRGRRYCAGEFERRIGSHPGYLLDRALQVEERRDLDQTADGDDHENTDQKDDRVLLEDSVFVPPSDMASVSKQESSTTSDDGLAASVAVIVFQMFQTISSAPLRNRKPPAAAKNVVRMHRLDGFDEGVFEKAKACISAPHQPLH